MNKEKAIEALENLSETVNRVEHSPIEANGIDRATQVICQMPDDNQWIPVTKMLPEENQKVWITKEYHGGDRRVDESIFRFGEFESSGYRGITCTDLVRAWIPRFVPEPYKEES